MKASYVLENDILLVLAAAAVGGVSGRLFDRFLVYLLDEYSKKSFICVGISTPFYA